MLARVCRGLAIGSTVAALMSPIPLASAQETPPNEVRTDAPTSSVPNPVSLPEGQGEATPPPIAPVLDARQSASRSSRHRAPNARPFFDPVSDRFIVVHSEGILALSSEGDVLASSTTVLPPGSPAWDGGPFWQTRDALIEIDPFTLSLTPHDFGIGRFEFAATSSEFWLLPVNSTGSLVVVDRVTNATRSVPLPPEIDLTNGFRMSHAPGIGDRLVVATWSGTYTSYLVDIATEPITVERTIDNEVIGFAPDGTLFAKGAVNSPVVNSINPDTGVVESTATFDGNVVWFDFSYADDADLLFANEQLRTRDGRLVREPISSYSSWVVSGDAQHAVSRADPEVAVQFLGPVVDRTLQAFFQPSWYDQILFEGTGLGVPTSVRVNGVQVDSLQTESGLSVDVSTLPETTDINGRIVIETVLGTWTSTLPATPSRGRAALSVRVVDFEGRDPNNDRDLFVVGCPGQRQEVRLRGGENAVFDVPGARECLVSGGDPGARVGFVNPTTGGAFADTNVSTMTVVTGRPKHLQFAIDLPLDGDTGSPAPPLWIFVDDIGGAPGGLTYPIRVRCGSWSQTVSIRSGFGARLMPPTGQGNSECTARLKKRRGADRITSFELSDSEVANRSGRKIEFERSIGGASRYLFFQMDFGKAEIIVPQVIGVPKEDIGKKKNAGVVHLLPVDGLGIPSGKGSIRFRQGKRGLGNRAEKGDRFGQATAVADFNGDGWLDVAISAPGEDLAGVNNAGIVHVIYGSATGYKGTRRQRLHQNTPGVEDEPERGDRFGEALAVVDYDGNGIADLAIGVPGERINGKKRAGMVQIIYGGDGGLDPSRGVETLTQDSPGVATAVSAGDRFGAALAGWRSYLVVGVPGEDVGSAKNAGAIHVFEGVDQVSLYQTQTPKRGVAEAGDRFGAAVSIGDRLVTVGAPGEDVGSRKNVGAVLVMILHESEFRVVSRRNITLKSMNLPGKLPAQARFGKTVLNLGGFRDGSLLIGAPGQDVSDKKGAGRVYIVDTDNFSAGGFWSQDAVDFPGEPGRGDAFGRAIDVNRRGGLVIAAPGEAVNGSDGAGAIYASSSGQDWKLIHQDRRGVATKAERDDGFGASIAG